MICDLKTDLMVRNVKEYKDYSMQELIHLIEYNNGIFPEHALNELIKKKDEAIPYLLDILNKVLENPRDTAENESYFAHIYAAYLLAKFRIIEAYPVYVEILKLPDELPHKLFGDSICEAGGRILASICGNKLEFIKDLIVNEQVDEFVRCQAVGSLAILALHGLQSRDEIIEYYRTLLTGGIHDKNSLVMAEVISSSNNIYPEEIMEEIRAAYQKELVDDSVIDLDFVERTLSWGKKITLEQYRNDAHHQLIHDTIDELRDWACFDEDFYYEDDMEDVVINTQTVVKEFKTERNDPCPCGSGKKYKKCCGK